MARRIILFAMLLVFLSIDSSFAQAEDDSLALTVTPPLMKINMESGESLATALKVVNNNNQPLTVYAKVLDFTSQGNGGVKFLPPPPSPVSDADKNTYLSQWITLNQDKVEVGPYQTALFPFNIEVPKDAQPGGHYAAILVGTNPPDKEEKGAEVKVASYISSLLLVRIAGTVDEKGMIREFVFSNRLYRGGEGSFRVGFQNSGNVHLQPMGDIKVYDMFGKLKGDIAVNNTDSNKDFGNVLPNSERVWDLKWPGDSFFLINRYKAELSLTYGEEAKQTDYQTFFFWGANLKWLAFIGGALLALFVLIIIFIKFYIRQSVKKLKKQFESAVEISESRHERLDIKERLAQRVGQKTEEKKIIDLRKRK
jgi:hypothetical protein